MFRGKVQRIHFIGIGGSGMCGIAEVLLNQGYAVSGSDQKESANTRRLRGLGGQIFIGHDAANVAGADVVVKSTAVPPENPEIVAAEDAYIPVIPRAEMLAELMRMKYGIAVAGTHGKTTTTSMVATCLYAAGLDPTVVIGGRLDVFGSSARRGAGEFMLAEADESDGSFMMLAPTVAVVTNIDPEHLEHWGTMEALVEGFVAFASKVPFYGFDVLCLDHPVVQSLIPRMRRRVVTYGLSTQAEVRGDNIVFEGVNTRFRVWRRDVALGEVQLGMPGAHNVSNALAAIAVGLELDVPFERLQRALQGFGGVDRRFSVRAERPLAAHPDAAAVTLIDDYGHHPAEIRATLTAAAGAWPSRRVIAVFQPHRYSRVSALLDDFARCFNAASQVLVCPIYGAGEAPTPGLDQHRVASHIAHHGHRHVVALEGLDRATAWLQSNLRPGDVVITLGAGDVNRVLTDLSAALAPPASPPSSGIPHAS